MLTGQLRFSVVSVVDAVKYITVYVYRDGNVSNEKLFQNGELLTYDRRYVYRDGQAGKYNRRHVYRRRKDYNEYAVDASKTELCLDGNCIEHGDTERDYVVKDALGRVLKESAYSEMDDYLIVKEYTYNKKG